MREAEVAGDDLSAHRSRRQDVLFHCRAEIPSSHSITAPLIRHMDPHPDVLTFNIPKECWCARTHTHAYIEEKKNGSIWDFSLRNPFLISLLSCSITYVKGGCTITLSISVCLPSPPYSANTSMNVGLFSRS